MATVSAAAKGDAPERQRALADAAFGMLRAALDAEEAGDGKEALRLYEQSRATLRRGLAVRFTRSEYECTKQLHRQMQGALVNVAERIQALTPDEPASTSLLARLGGVFGKTRVRGDEGERSETRRAGGTGAPPSNPFLPAKQQAPPTDRDAPTPPHTEAPPHPPPQTHPQPPAAAASAGVPLWKQGKLAAVPPALQRRILDEIVDDAPALAWDDIAGLADAKQTLTETVIWPALRPTIFTGLRAPQRGVLLFGPPGCGKTLLAKAVAAQAGKCTFFSISASSLMSKYVGEGERMVRALFAMAEFLAPSVVFVDEIDSLLTARSENEAAHLLRMQTELLVQMDGVTTNNDARVLLIGATNRPQLLDEAAVRRMPVRVYIPLPDEAARHVLLENALRGQHTLSAGELRDVVARTAGYSCHDLTALCKEAAFVAVREAGERILTIREDEIRRITHDDLVRSVARIRPSVTAQTVREMDAYARR